MLHTPSESNSALVHQLVTNFVCRWLFLSKYNSVRLSQHFIYRQLTDKSEGLEKQKYELNRLKGWRVCRGVMILCWFNYNKRLI